METPEDVDQKSNERSFAQIPDALVMDPSVGHLAVRVWCRLDKYAGKNGKAFPARETLAADLGVSVGSIKRALNELVDAGWLARERRAGGSWTSKLHRKPQAAKSVGSNMGRPRPTCEPTTAHIRATEGELLKDTQLRNAAPRVAAATPPPDEPAKPTPPRQREAPSQPQQKQQRAEDHPWYRWIRDAIPGRFSRSINRKTLNQIAADLQAEGWNPGSLHLAIRHQEWDGAQSAGAIVQWLRDAEPPLANKACVYCKGFGFYSEAHYEGGPKVVEECECVTERPNKFAVTDVEYDYSPPPAYTPPASTLLSDDPWATT